MGNTVSLADVHQAQMHVSDLRWSYWIGHVFGTFQWWFVLVFTLLLIYAWVKTLRREALTEVLLFGSLCFIVITFLDVLGGEVQLWDYVSMVLPWGARLICVDVDLAVIYMAVYQKYRAWGPFILTIVILALIFAFVLEPLSILMGIYQPYGWRHMYSVPFYILIPAAFKALTDKVSRTAKSAHSVF